MRRTLADVFGFGMTILEVMTFSQPTRFYNFQTIEIDESAIKQALMEASLIYSELLIFLVSSCFTKTPEKRYSTHYILDRISYNLQLYSNHIRTK